MTDDDDLARLLALLQGSQDARIPTTTFGRVRKTAASAMRAAGSAARAKLFGGSVVDDKTLEKVILSLGQLKGTAMKVAQIMSYVDARIPEDIKQKLAVLQSQSPRTPFSVIEQTIREDLGARAADLLAGLEREAVSSASIGQVHRARLPSGDDVAVKVLHPGIEQALRADFRGAQVAKSMVKLFFPGGDVSDFIAEAEETLVAECDYARELKNQQRFANVYANDDSIIVPRAFPELSSPRILTSAWHDGASLDAFLKTAPADAVARAATALFRFYVGTFYAHGFFNADPHPGNLLFHDDGRVVFLDYGCVREYRREIVVAMAHLSEAVRSGDDGGVLRAFEELGARIEPATRSEDEAAAKRLARAFFGPLLEPGKRVIQVGFTSALGDLVEHKRALLRLHLPGELLFLVRIRFGAYSVLSRMRAALDWRALEAEAATTALP